MGELCINIHQCWSRHNLPTKISIENEWSVISKRVEKIVEGMNVQVSAHISMSSSQSLFKQGSVTDFLAQMLFSKHRPHATYAHATHSFLSVRRACNASKQIFEPKNSLTVTSENNCNKMKSCA
jgi:hypothetical protein